MCSAAGLRSKGLKGVTCMGLLVWQMSVTNWKLLVLSVHKGLTPLVSEYVVGDMLQGLKWIYRVKGEGRAPKGALEQL